jgi:hypothetical protein
MMWCAEETITMTYFEVDHKKVDGETKLNIEKSDFCLKHTISF